MSLRLDNQSLLMCRRRRMGCRRRIGPGPDSGIFRFGKPPDDRIKLPGQGEGVSMILRDFAQKFFIGRRDDVLDKGIVQIEEWVACCLLTHKTLFQLKLLDAPPDFPTLAFVLRPAQTTRSLQVFCSCSDHHMGGQFLGDRVVVEKR